jgi:hypothetical protein
MPVVVVVVIISVYEHTYLIKAFKLYLHNWQIVTYMETSCTTETPNILHPFC